MSLSDTLRNAVRKRAGGCCEYCRIANCSGTVPFHVDHITPRKHGGPDDDLNLCFACFNCNMYKGYNLTGIDPSTGAITPLFHPRQQVWDEHFEIQADMTIAGLTPEGRTTVRVLRINLDERVESRRALATVDEYPCAAP